MITILMYLHAADEGGETHFPLIGLTVAARAHDALLFFDLQPDGSLEPMSRHAGLPVVRGSKFVGTKWLHVLDYIENAAKPVPQRNTY